MRLPQGTGYRLLLWVVACGLAAVTVLIVHARTLQAGIEELGTQGQKRIAVYLQSIKGELARYDYLPAILALSDDVAAMLRFPADSELREKVNGYLRRVNDSARSSAAYILDLDGRTLAASNSNDPISFVGVDLSYRPYFQSASKGTHGRFYAIGTTSGVPGYFYAIPIVRNGATLGVMALKVSLDSLEATWKSGSDVVSIADGNGVIFLSSLPSWKFRTLERLASTALEQIHDSRQYDGAVLTQVGISEASRSTEYGQIVRIDPSSNGRAATAASDYLEQRRSVPETDWQLLLFSDLTPARASARDAAIIAAFACGFTLLLALYLTHRWQALATEAAARRALVEANDRLEHEVAERTADLRQTNQHLEREVEERKRTEVVLREAQDGLVQAGKMAALGQMSAVVTHELNQPLAALRTLSDNAHVLLKRNRLEEVQQNLSLITNMIERMGSITAQLRSFSRKTTPHLTTVPVKRAVSNALFLIEQQLQAEDITLHQDLPQEELFVPCDTHRLEQVLVNLLTNAVDAVRECPTPRIDISVTTDGTRVSITVRDSGTGIPPDLLSRLFDPFFTTKDSSAGLGLGLTIAQEIVRAAGGTLQATNSPQGGAEFRVELPLARAGGADV